MLFQVLDSNQECRGVFCEGQIHKDYNGLQLTRSWSPSMHFKDRHLEYAQLWCNGKNLKDSCPEELLNSYNALDQKARAYLRSFNTAKINLKEVCFYDLVPESFLIDFFQIKSDIARSVFASHSKPENYKFLHDLCFFLMEIEGRDLKLDFKKLDFAKPSALSGLGKLRDTAPCVSYNPWTTATGRLTTNRNSFPILTLHKDLRSVIKPRNDCFLELDYNAAEVRVLFGLLGQEQPPQDIHEWISKNIFNNELDRESTKKKVFSWLYNPKAKNKKLNEYIDRDMIYDQYYINGCVHTPYKRTIEVNSDKALNYIIQSTASDMFLTSAMKVNDLLHDRKSNVSFCIHDSLVLDFALEDREILDEIKRVFSDTKFGAIKTNLGIGKDFGNMKRVK